MQQPAGVAEAGEDFQAVVDSVAVDLVDSEAEVPVAAEPAEVGKPTVAHDFNRGVLDFNHRKNNMCFKNNPA